MITEPIIIYGGENCTYCDKARELADELAFDYKYLSITGNQKLTDMFRMRGHATVPQIYINKPDGEMLHIGGYNEFKQWSKRNYCPSQITITGERL